MGRKRLDQQTQDRRAIARKQLIVVVRIVIDEVVGQRARASAGEHAANERAAFPGGDRGDGGVRGVTLDGNAVIVERNELAEGDGVCCASAARRERWVWRNGEMTEDENARRPALP